MPYAKCHMVERGIKLIPLLLYLFFFNSVQFLYLIFFYINPTYRKKWFIIDVLTKLANIYLDLNVYNWESFVPEIAEKYKNLTVQEQSPYISTYHKMIRQMLNNPAETIISWQYFLWLGKTFNEWLLFNFQSQTDYWYH